MKGFKDKSGKFRPTENKNGVRKSRDQSTKTEGVKLLSRKQRGTSVHRLPDFHISRHNWGLEFADGKVERVRLGNMVDTGWYWAGEGDQFNTFMARMSDTRDEWEEMTSDFKEDGITVNMIKSALLKNLSGKLTGDNDDGLYALSGDNVKWKFGENKEPYIEGEFEHFNNEGELKDNEEEEFEKEFWNHYKSPTYERWLEVKGNGYREGLKDGIIHATDFDELRQAYKDVGDNIEEDFFEFLHTESIASASWEAVEAIKTRRDEEGKQK